MGKGSKWAFLTSLQETRVPLVQEAHLGPLVSPEGEANRLVHSLPCLEEESKGSRSSKGVLGHCRPRKKTKAAWGHKATQRKRETAQSLREVIYSKETVSRVRGKQIYTGLETSEEHKRTGCKGIRCLSGRTPGACAAATRQQQLRPQPRTRGTAGDTGSGVTDTRETAG